MDHTTTIVIRNETLDDLCTKLSQTVLARIMSISLAHASIHMGAIEMIYGKSYGVEYPVAQQLLFD
jgi:hypothetical protein